MMKEEKTKNALNLEHFVLKRTKLSALFTSKRTTFSANIEKQRQLQDIENGFVVKDDIETGHGNIIPLWMFGMLY